jgi:hypothetical protein
MNRIIGDRKEKSALDEMEEVARERNKDVAKEDRLEAIRKAKEKAERAEAPSVITPAGIGDIKEDYICLEHIACFDIDGKVHEYYPKLYIKKDIERNGNGQFIQFTPYKGISHFEQQGNGLFLPSLGLTCNILAALFKERQNPEIEKILNQYWDYVSGDGNKYGWHAQNTLLDWHRNHIINYPYDGDFNTDGGNNVNVGKVGYRLSFEREGLQTKELEKVYSGNNSSMKMFMRQFTMMLEQPDMLVEFGKYFNKPAKIWIPNADCKDTRAAWLGCDHDYLYLDANGNLNSNYAARGVLFPSVAKGTSERSGVRIGGSQ